MRKLVHLPSVNCLVRALEFLAFLFSCVGSKYFGGQSVLFCKIEKPKNVVAKDFFVSMSSLV